jgi:2-dehydropantoate 2-reductase
MLSYSIIGMGAIGGYYGGRLAQAGREVHFLLHSDYQYVLQKGLRVDSCDGDFYLPHINAYAAPKDMPKTDVVIVSLKSVKNHDVLPELLRPIIHQNSIVVLIQNGIGLEEDLQHSGGRGTIP